MTAELVGAWWWPGKFVVALAAEPVSLLLGVFLGWRLHDRFIFKRREERE